MHYDSRIPIYLQVIAHLKKRIVSREINPGDKLPSARSLAVEYEINANTAARIYKEMEAMGLCFTERGTGTFVTNDLSIVERIKRETAEELVKNFVKEMSALGFSAKEMKQAIEEELK
ncbi:MAG: HTH-type transcriptional repressor YtrA [Firmicutes bacterium ADurb.Bin182]|nr:MAG: HTH-type transcriptional repressor YtrA [Firmicutes bacterium ADurb.Bin182]